MSSIDAPRSARREPPNRQPPPVQRLRVRYAKRGRMRFTSHRDFARAFERALRRADIPMAHSSGFHPHPRISFANAVPTGAASEAEFLEIALVESREPALVRDALDAALPNGLDVVTVGVVEPGAGSLADRLEASAWRLRLTGVAEAAVERAAARFLAEPGITVQRMTKRGLRTFDCRAAVVSLRVAAPAAPAEATSHDVAPTCAILEVVVRHETPAVRPDDVLAGLREAGGLESPTEVYILRSAQGPLDEVGNVGDPLN